MANDGTTNSKGCQMTNEEGQPCSAPPMRNSNFCFFHDPDKAQQRESARRAGGIERSRPIAVLSADTPDVSLKNHAQVLELLPDLVNRTLKGEVDPKVIHAVTALLNILMKALELSEVEKRLNALETLLRQRPA